MILNLKSLVNPGPDNYVGRTPCPKRQWSLVSVQLLPSSSFSSTVYHVSTIITTYPPICFTFRRHIVRQRRQYLAYTCGKYVDHIVHRDNTTFLIPCYHVNYTACPDTMYELLLLVCATSSIGCLCNVKYWLFVPRQVLVVCATSSIGCLCNVKCWLFVPRQALVVCATPSICCLCNVKYWLFDVYL